MLLPPLTQKGPANSAIQNTVVSLKPSTCNEMHCTMIYSIHWLQDRDCRMSIECVSEV